MLLSAGGFAIYRGFLPIYKILIPRFGSMKSRAQARLPHWTQDRIKESLPWCARRLQQAMRGGAYD